ncbi:molybdenum cofactor guanylyltransferase [Micromonospora echinaurantiaca]|uniref:molybdenum cofactor guanylyltransferase n=1 Tax=Micromonospora echinaurantiaca TaxID=47857 RepID=UPI001E38D8E8|nr:NTP transferase domain-containing protein [Micromonospora echinaurantiaca]
MLPRPPSGPQGYRGRVRAYAAVVLAGGAARRMGGVDKPVRPVGGRPMRDRVLAAVADAHPRVLVGPAGPVPAGVLVTREQPPGGGPVAATAAGLALLDPDTPVVALLAGDLPLLTGEAIGHLLRHLNAGPDGRHPTPLDQRPAAEPPGADTGGRPGAEPDGACFVDADGRRQTLCGVWRVPPLRAAVDRLAAGRGLAGAPIRALLAGLTVREVPWSGAGPPPWFDCDTDSDVRRAEEWVR